VGADLGDRRSQRDREGEHGRIHEQPCRMQTPQERIRPRGDEGDRERGERPEQEHRQHHGQI
jgi:hypothetical protein